MALRKSCPKCETINHCKKSRCVKCGYALSSKGKCKKVEMRKRRNKETLEMHELRKAIDRDRKARKRASESSNDIELRRASDRLCKANKRANESDCDTEFRRASNKLCQANKRANESDCDTELRRASDRLCQANKRANESDCDTELRRASDRLCQANKRANESDCDTELRRASDRLCKANKRANESDCDTELRRARDRLCQANKRANESDCDTELRRASNRLCQANKRANESECDTEMRREQDRCSTASARALSKSPDVHVVIQQFLSKVTVGPDYVCTCCHRMMYRHTVIGFKPCKYTKASPELLNKLFKHSYVASDGHQWVCKTCDSTLSRGNMPTQAKANGMELDGVPAELSCLNALEQRLISLRVPFMKMVALPSGKQRCMYTWSCC